MIWQGWFTLALLVLMIYGLARYAHLADVVFLGGLTLLALFGIVTPEEALSGFANPGMLTVAALFVVAAGLRDSGALDGISRKIMGPPRGERRALARLLAPVAACSAFLNNTTIVAMTMPVVLDWCRKHRLSPSRFLMPLSHATVAGGLCTLIGTSTNLVVHGLMLDTPAFGGHGLGFFEIGVVGVPIAVVTFIYLVLVGPRLLPERPELMERMGAERREYTVEMLVEATCPLIGMPVQEAGLRQLPGLYLVEIERGGGLITPVAPDEKLVAQDRLVFVGVVGTIVDLQKIRGLTPIGDTGEAKGLFDRLGRNLCEAVVSASSPMVGRSIRVANFRTVYDAAVVAVHRNGARLPGKIGDIVLRPGDALLLQTASGFVRAHRNNPDFYLVSEVGGSEPVRHERAWLSLCILGLMVALMALPDVLGWLGVQPAFTERFDRARVMIAFAAAGLMVIGRCVSPSVARRNVQWDVLYVIAAAFGVAKALEKTGAASYIVDHFWPVVSALGPIGALAAVYVIANIFTEFMTNNAAAALVFPIAVEAAAKSGADPRPFAIAVAVAASAAFATPIGYQTNLMVFGPGGYRFNDFLKVGLPLNVVAAVISVVSIAYWWRLWLPA